MGGIRIIVAPEITYLESWFFVMMAATAQMTNTMPRTAPTTAPNALPLLPSVNRPINLFNSEARERLLGAVSRVSFEANPPRFSKKGIRSSVPLKIRNEAKKSITEYRAILIDAHIFLSDSRKTPKNRGYILISPARTRQRYPSSRTAAYLLFLSMKNSTVNIRAK